MAAHMNMMRMMRAVLLRCSGGFILAVVCAGAGCEKPRVIAPPVEVHQSDWTFRGVKGCELVTEHYRIRTTCAIKNLLAMLPEFAESCWNGYSELVPPRHEARNLALSYLFQTRDQWEKFTDTFSPARARTYKLIRSGGYEENGVTVSHYGAMVTTLSVMSHEGLHQFLSLTRGGNIPAWSNEGLACYFEAFDLDGRGRPRFVPRGNLIRRNNLRDAMLNNQLFDLRELLSTNAGRVVSLPSERVRTYYAQAWSVVLFLLEIDPAKDEWGRGFRELLRDLGTPEFGERSRRVMAERRGEMEFGEAAFRAYVTNDLDGFEKRYRRFVHEMLRLD